MADQLLPNPHGQPASPRGQPAAPPHSQPVAPPRGVQGKYSDAKLMKGGNIVIEYHNIVSSLADEVCSLLNLEQRMEEHTYRTYKTRRET